MLICFFLKEERYALHWCYGICIYLKISFFHSLRCFHDTRGVSIVLYNISSECIASENLLEVTYSL